MVSESTDLGREKMRLEDSTPAGRDGQHSPVPPVSEPARRRRRPAVSCTNCRRRKVKCNREMPCSNCVAFQKEPCVYDGYPPLCRRLSRPPSQQETSGLADVSATLLYTQVNAPSASATNQSSPREDILSMKSRIKQLEDELATVTSRLSGPSVPTPRSNSEFTSSFLGGGIQIRHECRFHGQVQEIGHGLMHKTRLFGQSHWMNGVALVWNLLEVLEPYMRDGQSAVAAKLQRCKSLARTIKTCREPPWPTLLNASVPDRHISDKLVGCYLRTVETVYRIVHIPSFKRSYESLWTSSGPPDLNVVAQFKMVLAIGATMFDDSFSLRNEAVRWIFEVQTWLLRPRFKAQLNLQTLQTEILLILAREMVGVDSSATWVSISLIMRKAVQMGLHRDPAKLAKGSVFASEMRKRLFNTILELALQSSILSGGPPFIYPEEFDTEGPGNFDDEQLMEENPSPKVDKHFTQSSMARLLARTFSERLAIAKVLNSVNAGDSYEETLRLDSQLRAAYKDARKRFLPDGSLAATGESASHFASTFVEVLVNRYLLALHLPFHIPSLTNAGYAFSRKVVSDVSIKIWRSLFQLPVTTAAAATDQGYDDITRLTTSPWSFFHTLLRQVPLAICTELGAQLREEEDSLGPVPLRSDWVTIVEQAKVWFFRCIEIWNTNVKGYLLMRIVAGPIEAYMQSLDKDKVTQYLVYTAEEALEKCLAVLEKAAANVQPLPRTDSALVESMAPSDAVIPAVVDPSTTMGEDWDFMMADAEFNFGSAEPIDWLFDETTWKLAKTATQHPYEPGMVLQLDVLENFRSPPLPRLVSFVIDKILDFTMSFALQVTVKDENGKEFHAVLKLYDRRFGTGFRKDQHHTLESEEAFESFVLRSDQMVALNREVTEEVVGEDGIIHWPLSAFDFEHEGKSIPQMYAHVRVQLEDTVKAELAPYKEVKGILMQYIDGYSLMDLASSPRPPKQTELMHGILQSAVDLAHQIAELGVLLIDGRPANVVVMAETQAPYFIDFAQCALQEEVVADWEQEMKRRLDSYESRKAKMAMQTEPAGLPDTQSFENPHSIDDSQDVEKTGDVDDGEEATNGETTYIMEDIQIQGMDNETTKDLDGSQIIHGFEDFAIAQDKEPGSRSSSGAYCTVSTVSIANTDNTNSGESIESVPNPNPGSIEITGNYESVGKDDVDENNKIKDDPANGMESHKHTESIEIMEIMGVMESIDSIDIPESQNHTTSPDSTEVVISPRIAANGYVFEHDDDNLQSDPQAEYWYQAMENAYEIGLEMESHLQRTKGLKLEIKYVDYDAIIAGIKQRAGLLM